MPTELGIAYSPRYVLYPPGLSREDACLYEKWHHCGLNGAINLYFNVRLGQGRDPGESASEEMRSWWYQCTAKRADLIIEYKDRVEIVEFRNLANANACGRLLMYRNCWMEDPKIDKPLLLRLVTNLYDRDVEILCGQLQILYEVL